MNGAFCTVTKGLLKGVEDLEVGDYPNNSIIANGQNIEKSPGDLLSLNLQWKALMSNKHNHNQKKKKKKKKNYSNSNNNNNK